MAEQSENEALRLRNQMLENEVLDLKTGLEAIEERARSDLGMTREDEIFYRVIE
jgi:cell division protein FtsB